MSKSRSFSIYLLKDGFDQTNTLKDDHALAETAAADNLPEGATLFILDNQPNPPWWKGYFGITQNLQQTLKGAIIFLPVGDRVCAITFGHVYHNLQSEAYEYDFGIRITLNSLDPTKLKSLDSLIPENARRQRTQLPVGSDLTYFDFDRDSTILKGLTGSVKEEYKQYFRHATGASNIRISSDVGADGLAALCATLLEIYAKEDYKTAFPDIQNVTPVRDPVKVDALNAKLETAFRGKDANLTLTVPEIVNYNDENYVMFSGEGQSLIYDDVFIDLYYEYLTSKSFDLAAATIENLKHHSLVLTNETGQPRGDKPSILKCLIFDTTLDGGTETFHLCEGNWYLVDAVYVKGLSDYLDPLCQDTTLPIFNHENEAAFNEACVSGLEASRLCMDKKNISPKGQSQVEPCDVFEQDGNKCVLHHVKISTVSNQLSHLFNQGLNSVILLREEEKSFEKLKSVAETLADAAHNDNFQALIDQKNFKVIFQIVTHKDKNNKSKNLPLFSRISLKRTMKELKRMGIEAEYCFVKNEKEKADGKKKKRAKKAKPADAATQEVAA